MSHKLNQSTISRILKDTTNVDHVPLMQNIKMKKSRTAVPPRLKDALFRWIYTRNSKGVMPNGDLVKMFGKDLLEEANKLLPASDQRILKFSKGWVERFKKRFAIRFRRLHGKALSSDTDDIEHQMPRIAIIIITFGARNP